MSNLTKRIPKSCNQHLQTIVIFMVSCLLTQVTGTVKSAQTFKKISSNIGQLVTSSALVWESYTADSRQLEYAVRGGQYLTEDENYPILVCRAIADGIFSSGQTEKRKQKLVCVVSMHMDVKAHHAFDLLVNKGHGAKLTWRRWNKFIAQVPTGAVSATGGHVEDSYVARHEVKVGNAHHRQPEHHQQGADYVLGKFDSRSGLGKIIVIENQKEVTYEEGEVLVETEPVRYELREIEIDGDRSVVKVNTTELGSAILSNTDGGSNIVETVISYEYDKFQFWGSHDGIARGLPTHVYELSTVTGNVEWGLKNTERRVEMKAVSTNLLPGTALNVTLKGNYTSLEAPYQATLVAYFADNDNSVSRKISSVVQKGDMYDIKLELGPVYFIENGTLITTTTTTTTTTEPTTTTTREPKPVYTPPIVRTNSDSSFSSSSVSSSSGSSSSAGKSSEEFSLSGVKKHEDLDDSTNNELVNDQNPESSATKSEIPPKLSSSQATSLKTKTIPLIFSLAIIFMACVSLN